MSIIQGNAHTSAGGYQIERSLRFNSADSAYLNRTLTTPTDGKKFSFSFWAKRSALSSEMTIFAADAVGSNNESAITLNSGNTLEVRLSGVICRTTTQLFRDPSAWYHIVIALDTTQATANDRVKVYLNGTQITAFTTTANPTQNSTEVSFNTAIAHYIGRWASSGIQYFDGYLTETYFIDGQALTPSSFGETNSNTGVWKPKAFSGTYGTNGFYLKFADNSNTTAATLGKDSSGNGNNWTPNNFSVTAGAGNDSMVDSPTSYGTDTGVGGEVRGNYATLNPLAPSSYVTISNGNLTATGNTSTNSGMAVATIGVATGKIVWEETITTVSGNFPGVGATTVILQDGNGQNPAASNTQGVYYRANGTVYKNSASLVGTYATFSNGDVVRFELDADALTCAIYKNNTLIVTVTGLTAGTFYPSNVNYNSSVTNSNFGQRPFANTANSGFKALCTQNLPTPTIGATSTTQANDYFNTVLWTGDGSSSRSITGVGFAPDFVWVKQRSAPAQDHSLQDIVRGTQKMLFSSSTSAEYTATTYGQLTSFDSDGFTASKGTDATYSYYNQNTYTYVAWNWKANGAGSSNTAGTITSTVSASTTSGFSIVTYTGTGSNATVGHGIGTAPTFIIVKRRNSATAWPCLVKAANSGNGQNGRLNLNETDGYGANIEFWNNTSPTSTVFSVGIHSTTNASGGTYVAYCFAPVAGYSAFGSYVGNGSTDGPFIYFGFRPAWIMIKQVSANGEDWQIYDKSRPGYNITQDLLGANSSAAETTGGNRGGDFTSNGFKIRTSGAGYNASGATYVYMAFAESPFRYSLAR